jgi:hypothetical protein
MDKLRIHKTADLVRYAIVTGMAGLEAGESSEAEKSRK